ncbi:MAG TPA: ABC transporter substrate-binding protein [Terriglobales bacterium]|jgi:NitT/TauT family transport system substrate-binding protein|nr:ABC transporter substrate-binding protein [Terriglobales bacterium]
MISFLLRHKSQLLFALLLSITFAHPSAAAEAPQKLRVAYAAVTAAFSIPWIAKEAGIFQRHGLDVELVYIASGSRAVQTLVGGGIDVAEIGGPAGVDARLAGADTVYIAIPVNRVIVFTVAGPQVQRVEELRGKSIGVTRVGTVTDFFTRVYLRQNGLVPDRDVMIRQMGGLPEIVAGLKAGQIEGGTFGFPAVLHARAAGFHVLVDYNTAGYRYPLSTVIVTEKLLRTRESAIRRFLQSHIEAVHRFKTDPEFAMKVIGKYTNTTDRAMLEETQRIYADAFERVPYPNIEDLRLGITQVSETNPRAKGADPKDFVDPRLLREIEASGFVKQLYGEASR